MNLFTDPQETSKTNQDANPDGVMGVDGVSVGAIGNISEELRPFINKVFNEDAFSVISRLPDSCLSLCLTDPPFSNGADASYGRSGKEILGDGDMTINQRFLDAIYPKMKDNSSLYLFCDHKMYDTIKAHALATGWKYKMLVCYVKSNIGMGADFRLQHEIILVIERKDKGIYNRRDFSNVQFAKHIAHNQNSHPHMKDYDVLRKIILHSSNPSDLVGDFFMGSFSTALCCYREARNFVGTELDPVYYKLGDQKLKDLMSQKRMFE